jgi:3-methyladenine DNA glycosylase AlkD
MAASIKTILKEIKDYFEENQNPEIVKKYSRYFKDGYDAYGIDQQLFVERRKYLYEKYKDVLGLKGFLEFGSELVKTGKYENISLAITLPLFFKEEFDKKSLKTFESWLESGFKNWANVDVFCGEVMKIFLKEEIINFHDIDKWRFSESKWKRRAVPVSLLHLLKGKTDYKELLEFVAPLMHDSERVVHQGMGWFLREAWKIKPKPVETFLLKYKDTAPRLIFQYATEKMSKEEKLRFKAEKKKK